MAGDLTLISNPNDSLPSSYPSGLFSNLTSPRLTEDGYI